MTVIQAWHRGNNLVATSIVTLAGFAFASEIFEEDEGAFKLDDIALFLLALVSLWWYRRGEHRFHASYMPFLFIIIGLLIKIGGLIVEFNDKADAGDDFGGITLFVLSALYIFYLFRRKAPTS